MAGCRYSLSSSSEGIIRVIEKMIGLFSSSSNAVVCPFMVIEIILQSGKWRKDGWKGRKRGRDTQDRRTTPHSQKQNIGTKKLESKAHIGSAKQILSHQGRIIHQDIYVMAENAHPP